MKKTELIRPLQWVIWNGLSHYAFDTGLVLCLSATLRVGTLVLGQHPLPEMPASCLWCIAFRGDGPKPRF